MNDQHVILVQHGQPRKAQGKGTLSDPAVMSARYLISAAFPSIPGNKVGKGKILPLAVGKSQLGTPSKVNPPSEL
jgi:hypothetical protein